MALEMLIGLALLYFFIWIVMKLMNVQKEVYSGKASYADHSSVPEKPFFSRKYLLAGKPDLIIRNKDGVVPVEVKSGRRPYRPYRNHVMQLASYCLLLEESGYGDISYGLLQYRDGSPFRVEYTEELKHELEGIMKDMRQSLSGNHLVENGHDRGRCGGVSCSLY